jgi:hypothetical protein
MVTHSQRPSASASAIVASARKVRVRAIVIAGSALSAISYGF